MNAGHSPAAIGQADQGQVILIVDGDDFRIDFFAAGKFNLESFAPLGDVAIGEDQAIAGNKESRSAPSSHAGLGTRIGGAAMSRRTRASHRGRENRKSGGRGAGDVVLGCKQAGRFQGRFHLWQRGKSDGAMASAVTQIFHDVFAVLDFGG